MSAVPPNPRPTASAEKSASAMPTSSAEKSASAEDDSAWNPDGTDLARALVGRAKAAGRSGALPARKRRAGEAARARSVARRRAPGAGWSGPGGDERDPQSIGVTLDRLVGEHGWDDDLAVHGVVARWDQVVGAEIAAHVQPDHYADGVVTVRADSTAWATQVRMLASQLVKRLNEEIGEGTVTRVNVLGPQAPSWRKGPRRVSGRGPRDTYG